MGVNDMVAALRPSARELLLRLSVFRAPCDTNAALFQVGTDDPALAAEPDYAALETVVYTLAVAHGGSKEELSQAVRERRWRELPYAQAIEQAMTRLQTARPIAGMRGPDGFGDDLAALTQTGLLVQAGQVLDLAPGVVEALRPIAAEQLDLTDAHTRAARYWAWRSAWWKRTWRHETADLLQACWHLVRAQNLDSAYLAGMEAFTQLKHHGDVGEAQTVLQEMLTWLPAAHSGRGICLHELAVMAFQRGELDQSEQLCRESLALAQEQGNPLGAAMNFTQLGRLYFQRGQLGSAEEWFHRALALTESLDYARTSTAVTYHQLGMVADDRGQPATADRWYRQSLSISEELGDEGLMAGTYHQLGSLALKQEHLGAAEDWYQRALAIKKRIEDQRGIGTTSGQLGQVALQRGQLDVAYDWYRQALQILEPLDDLAAIAAIYNQLGYLESQRGELPLAEEFYRAALAIGKKIGDVDGVATTLAALAILYVQLGRLPEAVVLNVQSLGHRLGAKMPIGTNLNRLAELRRKLGDSEFRRIIETEADAEVAAKVIGMIDRAAPPGSS